LIEDYDLFFFLNNLISVIVWLLVAYLFNFSVIGWIVGLVASFIFHEFIGPLFTVKSGDKYLDKK
jgi:multisubunit Na+/H+ antiporter MnhE subunit